MRRLLLALVLVALTPSSVLSDADLTQAVNVAFLFRTEDPALHELAHQRALEASVNFSHVGATTAEVLAWNQGMTDPVSTVVRQWLESPAHFAILMDPTLTLIGCGSVTTSDGRYTAACLLSQGGQIQVTPPTAPAPPVGTEPAATPPVIELPDAAMRTP